MAVLDYHTPETQSLSQELIPQFGSDYNLLSGGSPSYGSSVPAYVGTRSNGRRSPEASSSLNKQGSTTPVNQSGRENAPSGGFRLNAKRFFLTYPCAPVHFSVDFVLIHFKTLYNPRPAVCIVSRELHKDGSPHFHVFLEFDEKRNIKDSRHFDIPWSQPDSSVVEHLHPNIQSVRSKKSTINYIVKDGDFKYFGISKVEIDAFKNGLNQYLAFLETIPDETIMMKKYPAYTFRYLAQSRSYVEIARKKRDREKCAKFIWPTLAPIMEQRQPKTYKKYKAILHILFDAIHKKRMPRSLNLYIAGITNTGKSRLFCLLSKFFSVYFAPIDEDYYDLYDDSHKIVVFDEYMSTKSITWINTFSGGYPMSIKKKCRQYQKTANPLVVILSNLSIDDQYPNIRVKNPELWRAFRSRFAYFSFFDSLEPNLHPLCEDIRFFNNIVDEESDVINPY